MTALAPHTAPGSFAQAPAVTPTICRAATKSPSVRPGDRGHAVSVALEHLAVQVAFPADKPEPGILIGRDVRLNIEAHGDGVVIRTSPDRPQAPLRRTRHKDGPKRRPSTTLSSNGSTSLLALSPTSRRPASRRPLPPPGG